MKADPASAPQQDEFDRLLIAMRPRLHRYCARMVGSVVDGEDIVQDALIKAVQAWPAAAPIAQPEGWLFRIAHNTALDFLRRRSRLAALETSQGAEPMANPHDATALREMTRLSLRLFMQLPVGQRGSVILIDVLGCAPREVCEITGMSLVAVKAALHRGRARLRELAANADHAPQPELTPSDRARLSAYAARFNAHDFDAVRAMLADDIRLDLVGRLRMRGKVEVSRYFGNYAKAADWHLVPGVVEGRPALLVVDPTKPDAAPGYFMLLEWSDDGVTAIRDFRHASYIIDGADFWLSEH
ncbi:MAG: sigma-70 family RNA polymerase sigma factor [Bradyrhizobium sp.]|jgi:RNA polymerase sigma-70 factor, ECF subfamily|uniref:sigma-70 family RNA polymerase sigma factor n=1 Tax=Bradyrhizobium sp. TaxID=376 RepID=UPI003C7B353F